MSVDMIIGLVAIAMFTYLMSETAHNEDMSGTALLIDLIGYSVIIWIIALGG